MAIRLKRIYEAPTSDDGRRILVDRLWPRGISKEDAAIDDWLRDIAPSRQLRTWFDHDPEKWAEFRRRYMRELKVHRDLLHSLAECARNEHVTLVYAASNKLRNNAIVVEQYLAMFSDQ